MKEKTLTSSPQQNPLQWGARPQPNIQAGWLSRERGLAFVLIVATALALYLCYRLAYPFFPALAWALALAIMTHPLHQWIARWVRSPNLAAGCTVVLVAVLLITPSSFLLQRLATEISRGVERLQSEAAAGEWSTIIERNPRLTPILHWLETHVDIRDETQHAAQTLTSYLPSFVTGSVWAVVELLIILFFLFYFFRDRHAALQALRSIMPLSNAETTEVFTRVTDTIYATIYGTLVVAFIQGALGGLMFWWLDLPAPLVWGMVMALLAIAPVLGAFVIWAPAAIFLALEGNLGKALLLTVWGGIVIGLIDNLLYPVLVGKRLRLHTLPIFIAIIGGLALFGASGLILGPVVLAITVALVDVWRRRTVNGQTAEDGVSV